ncbi:hypothetical protein M0R04_06975 [Candidatus Dojkabacteria bacterium]|jgi:hypothetical protein|nr:hypothetical protein [Candidatus Dojkabacteria bacterium]
MKLNEIKDTNSLKNIKIFCDLDGCLTDFPKFCKEHIGIMPRDIDTDKALKRDFWKRVRRWIENGNKFFEDMDPMPDAHILWDYIKKYDPTVLTAIGSACKGASGEKLSWVRKHLGSRAASTAIMVQTSADKAQYAKPYCVLIDDREKSIDPWRAAGGIGILHVSALDTVAQLKKLGL